MTNNESKQIFTMAKSITDEINHIDRTIDIREPQPLSAESTNIDRLLNVKAWKMYHRQVALLKEMSIGYCCAIENNGEKELLFFRHYTPSGVKPANQAMQYVSYLSPVGSLVAQEPGTDYEVEVPNGQRHFKINQIDIFQSLKNNCTWDATNNRVSLLNMKLSIKSLLALLKSKSPIDDDKNVTTASQEIECVGDTIALTSEEIHNIINSINSFDGNIEISSKPTIKLFSLTDNPILDTDQDSIFRKDLKSKVIITGAPGTGKTTIMVKRLSQKTKYDFLSSSEKQYFKDLDFDSSIGYDKGWVLYCPNELLRNYLKETMNKENLSATNDTVRAWDHEKINLARDCYGILKIKEKGIFRLTNDTLPSLSNSEFTKIGIDYEKFFIKSVVLKFKRLIGSIKHSVLNLRRELDGLFTEGNDPNVLLNSRFIEQKLYNDKKLYHQHSTFVFLKSATRDIDALLDRCNLSETIFSLLNTVKIFSESIHLAFKEKQQASRRKHDDANNSDLRSVWEALEKLKEYFILSVHSSGYFEKNSDNPLLIKYNLKANKQNISIAMFYYACGVVKSDKILKFKTAFDHYLSSVFYDEKMKRVISISTCLNNIIENFIYICDPNNIVKQCCLTYSEFRNSNSEFRSYFNSKDGFIGQMELDILLYNVQKIAWTINRTLNHYNFSQYNIGYASYKKTMTEFCGDNNNVDYLKNIKERYRYYVCIDEVTDFSALQIGAILFLSNPKFFSITLSGDLMQRTTQCGISSWNDLNILFNSADIYTLQKVYRLNPTLLDVAKTLYEQSVGKPADFVSPYEDGNYPHPLKFIGEGTECSNWVVERIIEIYNHYGYLPSVAIFVPSESDIEITFDLLKNELYENAIETEACHGGKVLGNDSKVRIFSVGYIKGLEFDSVFFWGVDTLDRLYPGLVDKYLYVGLTRAASFLAMTARNSFPPKLSCIIDKFRGDNWKDFVAQ